MKTAIWTCITLLIGFAIGCYVGTKYEHVYSKTDYGPGVSDDFKEKMRALSEEMDANYEQYQKERRIQRASQ